MAQEGGNFQQKAPSVEKESMNVQKEDVETLKRHFPQVFTENKIDFEKFKEFFSESVETGSERYLFTWAGKSDAIKILQTPTRATLKPDRNESVNFDTTKNIFIEGDNLEVLKLLYKSYFGKVKMIYIDPPYNTGNDFIYEDNYADPLDSYLRLTGQKDTEGNVMTSNPETGGRYHSSWLNMIYPRLFIAKQLLTEDGVIFISIDDNEIHNLKIIMNEVFGEENFIETLVWKRRATAPNDRVIGKNHEYILVYSKNINLNVLYLQPRDDKSNALYKNLDNDPRGPWSTSDLSANGKGGRLVESCIFPIINPLNGNEHYPPKNKCWLYNRTKIDQLIKDKRIGFRDNTGTPYLKRFLSEVRQGITQPTIIDDGGFSQDSAKEIKEIFFEDIFEFPKPTKLIKKLITCGMDKHDIFLDFFVGSATSCDALFQLNNEDYGERKFIVVQIPEITAPDSTAKKAGYDNIADIGKERIRRVIKKLEAENKSKLDGQPQDLGFKVFKLTESNYRSWKGVEERKSDAYGKQMELFNDPLMEGWNGIDVIYEVALKEGYSLTIDIQKIAAGKCTVFKVMDEGQYFFITLDDEVHLEDVKKLDLKKDDLFVCRDVAIDDEVAANLALQCRFKTI